MTHLSHDSDLQARGIGPIFIRVYWMFFGNVLLAISSLGIAQGDGALGLADVGFWFAIPSVIAARFFDISRFAGLTGTGERATMQHWRKYALGMAVGGILVWLAAHGFAYLMHR